MDLLSINRLATLSRQEVSKNDVNKEYLMKILKFLRSKDPNDPNLTRQLSPKYIPKSNRYKNTQISPNGLASEKKYVAESLKSFLPNIYSNKLINDPQTRSIKVFKIPIDVENKVLRKPVQLLRQYSSVLKTSKNDISKSSEMQQNQDEHSS